MDSAVFVLGSNINQVGLGASAQDSVVGLPLRGVELMRQNSKVASRLMTMSCKRTVSKADHLGSRISQLSIGLDPTLVAKGTLSEASCQ